MLVCSNNTNKLSPQELFFFQQQRAVVQIIQINLALKNVDREQIEFVEVQIIQINLALKNNLIRCKYRDAVQIIQINLALKNLRPLHLV